MTKGDIFAFLKIRTVPHLFWSAPRPLTIRPPVISVVMLAIGLFIFGLGEALLIASGVGVSPWTVLAQGITNITGWSVGLATFLVSSTVLLLWVPLVALLGPWSLPIVQIGLISAGGLVLYELARCDLDERIACWIALSYFASGTVIGPSLENFHDLCAVPVLVFSLLLGIRRSNRWLYGTAALLLPLVREDVGLLAFSLGLWMVLRQPRWRWAGVGLCLYATAAVVLITNTVQPLFGTEVSDRLLSARFGHFLGDQGGKGSTLDLL